VAKEFFNESFQSTCVSLEKEYGNRLDSIQNSVDENLSEQGFLSLKLVLDNVMPFILLLIVFVIIFQFFVPITPGVQIWIDRANWTLITYFALRLAVVYRLSNNHTEFFRQHWLDMLLVIPLFSLLQEVRALKLLEEASLLGTESASGSRAAASTGAAAKLTRISRIIKRSI
jgi:hypothetical protein